MREREIKRERDRDERERETEREREREREREEERDGAVLSLVMTAMVARVGGLSRRVLSMAMTMEDQ
jgi:hypothetical protein